MYHNIPTILNEGHYEGALMSTTKIVEQGDITFG